MKKIKFLILVILFSCFILTGCNKESSNLKKITVAEVTHSVFYAPWYVALENGYFEDEGLDIEVILTPGADKVGSAVLSGDVEIGFSGLEATIYVYDNLAKDYLISFAGLTKRDGQFLLGDCNLKDNFKIDDLKGKTILVGRKAGMPAMVFEYGLHLNGISNQEVNLDTSVEFAALSGAFIGGAGDFVNLFEPTALNLEKNNYGCVLTSVGLLSGELPYTVFHTKKSYLEKNKDTLKSFSKALDKGLKFVKENDSNVIAQAIIDQFPDTSLNDLSIIVERYKNADSWWDNTHITEDAYDNLLNLMEYNKAIDKKTDYNILVNSNLN